MKSKNEIFFQRKYKIFTYLSPCSWTDRIETPYVINVEDTQQNVHIIRRVTNEKLLIISMNVPLLSTIIFSVEFSYWHFIAIISYVFEESFIPLILAALSTVFTACVYFRFTKSQRKLSGNIQKNGNIAKPNIEITLRSHLKDDIYHI